MNITTDLRVRSRVTDQDMEPRRGKCPGDADYDALLTGPTRITKLDGRPLAVFLPGALLEAVNAPGVYEVLHSLRTRRTTNRGPASGTRKFTPDRERSPRSYALNVSSVIIGAADPMGLQKYCRLTSWTGTNLPKWQLLNPLLRGIAGHLAEQVPERYAAQNDQARVTDPAWTVPGTPFTTVTVNNSYPTGVHTDKGDLDAGFSTIACLRRGAYTGGRLVFPQFRLAVDMHHGDLILMDAHEYHGNTIMSCACGTRMHGPCKVCDAERISVVAYYRTRLADCGTVEQERRKAEASRVRIEEKTLGAARAKNTPQ